MSASSSARSGFAFTVAAWVFWSDDARCSTTLSPSDGCQSGAPSRPKQKEQAKLCARELRERRHVERSPFSRGARSESTITVRAAFARIVRVKFRDSSAAVLQRQLRVSPTEHANTVGLEA